MRVFDTIRDFIKPKLNPDIEPVFNYQSEHLPTFWLLGKTGAGKSSLIHAVTLDSRVEIGDGFRPCTKASQEYDFPADKALLRFLDTRGLAEADYNAEDDIGVCQHCSNALIVVMKVEEPEQSCVLNALNQIREKGSIEQILLIHTGIHLIENTHDRKQCISHNQHQCDKAWGDPVSAIEVDFELENGKNLGVDLLRTTLSQLLPVLTQLDMDEAYSNAEEKNFAALKKETLWYSASAGATDAFPAIGIVSVPMIQAKMLHSLAKQYGMDWNKKTMSEFAGALGASFGVQYGVRLGVCRT